MHSFPARWWNRLARYWTEWHEADANPDDSASLLPWFIAALLIAFLCALSVTLGYVWRDAEPTHPTAQVRP